MVDRFFLATSGAHPIYADVPFRDPQVWIVIGSDSFSWSRCNTRKPIVLPHPRLFSISNDLPTPPPQQIPS
ncbi:unnamed protein product [Cochlearia groenlandica]